MGTCLGRTTHAPVPLIEGEGAADLEYRVLELGGAIAKLVATRAAEATRMRALAVADSGEHTTESMLAEQTRLRTLRALDKRVALHELVRARLVEAVQNANDTSLVDAAVRDINASVGTDEAAGARLDDLHAEFKKTSKRLDETSATLERLISPLQHLPEAARSELLAAQVEAMGGRLPASSTTTTILVDPLTPKGLVLGLLLIAAVAGAASAGTTRERIHAAHNETLTTRQRIQAALIEESRRQCDGLGAKWADDAVRLLENNARKNLQPAAEMLIVHELINCVGTDGEPRDILGDMCDVLCNPLVHDLHVVTNASHVLSKAELEQRKAENLNPNLHYMSVYVQAPSLDAQDKHTCKCK